MPLSLVSTTSRVCRQKPTCGVSTASCSEPVGLGVLAAYRCAVEGRTQVTSDDRKPKAAHPKSRRTLAIAGGVIGLLLIVGAAGLFWYLNQPVPDEVSIESAVADVASSQPPATDVTATDVTETAGSETRLDGTWIVDTSIGDFSFEEATSSFVGFRIKEELATVGATTAVGRTPVLEGSLALDGATISNLTVEADLSQIVTNASRRDRAVQRALDTG